MKISTTPQPHRPGPKKLVPPSDGTGRPKFQARPALTPGGFLKKATGLGAAAVRSFEALPEFISPSIYGTPQQRAQVEAVLDSLPLNDVGQISTIRWVPEIPNNKPGFITLGRAHDRVFKGEIQLSTKALTTPERLEQTLTHEVGHTTDYAEQPFGLFGKRSGSSPWGEGERITEYAKTNEREDFAESYEEYHLHPENLKERIPEKYEDLQELHKQSLLERMVDREEFRETGKYIGNLIGPNRSVRNLVEGARYGMSVAQFGHGVLEWVGSAKSGDPMAHTSGILNTISGGLLWSGVSPTAAMGVQGANQALQSAVRRGALKAEDVESTVAAPFRPIEAVFGRDKVDRPEDRQTAKVVGTALGGALGGATGAIVGPYAGVLAGYHLAGGLGGTLGMIGGGLLGFYGGSELGGRLGGALFG